jgi:hypothetical protein
VIKARELQLIDSLTDNAKLTDDLYTLINFKVIDCDGQELKKIIMKTQRENLRLQKGLHIVETKLILSIQQYQAELQRIQQQGMFAGGVDSPEGAPVGYNSNYAKLMHRNDELSKEIEFLREEHHQMGCKLEDSSRKVKNYECMGEAGDLISKSLAKMESYENRSGRALMRIADPQLLENDDDDLIGSDSNIPRPAEYTEHQRQLHHQEFDVTHKTPMQTTQKKHAGLGTTDTKDDS